MDIEDHKIIRAKVDEGGIKEKKPLDRTQVMIFCVEA